MFRNTVITRSPANANALIDKLHRQTTDRGNDAHSFAECESWRDYVKCMLLKYGRAITTSIRMSHTRSSWCKKLEHVYFIVYLL